VSIHLQIQVDRPFDYRILIFDLNGALLLNEVNSSSINVNQFSSGIYLLEIIDTQTKEKIVEKIVVTK